MDFRSLIILGLRLWGLHLVISTVVSFPALLVSHHPYPVEGWSVLLGYTAAGLVLVLLPGRITSGVLRVGKADVKSDLSFEQVLRIGLILLGVYFTVNAAFWFLFTYAKVQMFYDVVKPFANPGGSRLNPEDFAILTSRALEFVLGLGLWLGNRPIASLTARIGDDR
jgi:hypothetical protein